MRFPRLAILAPGWTAAPERTELLKVLIEDVANELARHRTFAVLAPHSSFQVDHDSGVPRKNGILRADYTVSGFVKPRGSGESLALRMVNCARQEIVWAAEFPISQSELMSSFRMLAIRISASLASGLETDMLLHLRKNGSGTAYLHYLEGQRWLKNCDLPRLRRARKAFGESISKDGRFAPAHARIAQTLYLEWLLLGGDDPRLLVDAREHAGLALALDPNNALGHWMAGVISLYQRDFDHSAEKFEEAEVLNPNSADLLVQHADALSHFGNAEAGWKKFERAIDLNPLPPDHYWWAGASIAFVQGDLARSIELCGRLKNDEPVLRLLAASHALAGNIEPARTYGKRLAELYPGQSAAQMFKIAPDRDSRVLNRFLEGLRLAGVK